MFEQQRFIVSLSSVPSRIAYIKPTIESLLNQTVKADRIYVAIPFYSKREKKRYNIPRFLLKDKRITLIRSRTDWGPATKLLPVLQIEKDPTTLILTVDDDRIYDKDMIKEYLKFSKRYPNSILGRRGWILKRPHFKWPFFFLIEKLHQYKKIYQG